MHVGWVLKNFGRSPNVGNMPNAGTPRNENTIYSSDSSWPTASVVLHPTNTIFLWYVIPFEWRWTLKKSLLPFLSFCMTSLCSKQHMSTSGAIFSNKAEFNFLRNILFSYPVYEKLTRWNGSTVWQHKVLEVKHNTWNVELYVRASGLRLTTIRDFHLTFDTFV